MIGYSPPFSEVTIPCLCKAAHEILSESKPPVQLDDISHITGISLSYHSISYHYRHLKHRPNPDNKMDSFPYPNLDSKTRRDAFSITNLAEAKVNYVFCINIPYHTIAVLMNVTIPSSLPFQIFVILSLIIAKILQVIGKNLWCCKITDFYD